MKILVIGASHGTGALTVKEALDRGHEVTAFSRNPENLQLEHPQLRRAKGSFHDAATVFEAVKGQDAVIVTASATTISGFREKPRYFSDGTANVIKAMQATGSKRLIVLSALGVGESRPLMPWFLRKLIIDMFLRLPYQDHERQEALLRDSKLDWVIARPSRLTDGPARHKYVKQPANKHVPNSISRADVADFLVEAATSEAWVKKIVLLGG